MIEAFAVGDAIAVAVAGTGVGLDVGKGVTVAVGRAVRVGVAVICGLSPQADKHSWPNISVVKTTLTSRLKDLF